MFTHIHSTTIHNSQKVEEIQMCINKLVEKQIIVYKNKDILLFTHIKEWNTNAYYNVDEPQKHYVNERSQPQNVNIVWPHLNEIFTIGKTIETYHRWVVAKRREQEEGSRIILGWLKCFRTK